MNFIRQGFRKLLSDRDTDSDTKRLRLRMVDNKFTIISAVFSTEDLLRVSFVLRSVNYL